MSLQGYPQGAERFLPLFGIHKEATENDIDTEKYKRDAEQNKGP